MGDYALLLQAGPADTARTLNALEYALMLDDHGHGVEVYLDGEATRWPGEFDSWGDHPVKECFDDIQDRGLLVGACGYCASAFGNVEECEGSGIEILGDSDHHGPDVGAIASDDRQLLTIG